MWARRSRYLRGINLLYSHTGSDIPPTGIHTSIVITQRPNYLIWYPQPAFLASEPVDKTKRVPYHLRPLSQGDAALIVLVLPALPPFQDECAHAVLLLEDHNKVDKRSLPGSFLTPVRRQRCSPYHKMRSIIMTNSPTHIDFNLGEMISPMKFPSATGVFG